MNSESRPIESIGGCFLRLSWVIGCASLLSCAFAILRNPTWSLGMSDLVYWVLAGLTVLLTWVDHRAVGGRRPLFFVTLFAVGVWLAAQAVQLEG